MDDNIREELYDVVEEFYATITSNTDIDLKSELDKFIGKLKDIKKEM